jgi:uncharacterized protein (UPF0276 family)
MPARPKVGLSLLPADDLRREQLPLFAEGAVEAIEWTIDAEFDAGLDADSARWIDPLLDHYAAAGALYGHGVHFSPLSAFFEQRQARWLADAGGALAKRPYRHLSEHFGFSTVPGVARGAPLPVPFEPGAVAIGRDRLRRLEAAAGVPVGLENLALAFSRDDVLAHGEFLDALLAPSDGFLLLDLHNLYCQSVNFDVQPDVLAHAMPLERVREVHLSGGRWATLATPDGPQRFRRDTHDDRLPEEVLSLLALILPRCPRLEAVFVERLGGTLPTALDGERYREDYRRVRDLVLGADAPGTRVTAEAPHG